VDYFADLGHRLMLKNFVTGGKTKRHEFSLSAQALMTKATAFGSRLCREQK
jgi:hypothetical protein